MSNAYQNIYPQNIIKKKNIELTTRKIFNIILKSNEFNNVILNELNGYQNIFYLKNKKIFLFHLRRKKKQELDILKNQEIILLKPNSNHDSLICLTNNGCIYSINYETMKIKYFSNLDYNKFIIPNIIPQKKRSFSFSKKTSDKNNFNNLNYIYNIFCNNNSDKIVLNLNKYILFWYQNNYNIDNNNEINNNQIESVSGTIYSIIKESEINKIDINNNLNNYEIINEGVETIFGDNYFLGSYTRIFYVILINLNNEIKLYIFDYLFKFNYKNRFRSIADIQRNDFNATDLFNGSENEDLNDIKSKISSTNLNFIAAININNNNKNILPKKNNTNKLNENQILLKANSKGNVLAIIINDDTNKTNLLNVNSTLIYFMIETYSFSSKRIIDIIGKQFLLKNKNDIYITSIEWICHDMFLIILTSKGYFFLININFQVTYLTDVSDIPLSNYDTYYIIPELEKKYLTLSKKNDNNNLCLYVSKQREDLFIINDSDYVACYQINYKMYENKIINTEIPTNNFQNFLFLLKYYQLYKSQAQFDYLTPEELSNSLIYLMERHLQTLFKKDDNIIPIQIPESEIIQTETGIKVMQMKQNEEDEMKQNSIRAQNNKNYFDYFQNR